MATPEMAATHAPGDPVERAVAWLTHFQPEELKKILERWELPASESHPVQLETFRTALEEGRHPVPEPYELEAMRRLAAFSLPEQKEFLRRCGLPVGGNQVQVLQAIEKSLGPRGVPIDTAFDYIDELHENGEQHILLFRFKVRRAAQRFTAATRTWERLRTLRSLPDEPPGDRALVRRKLYEPRARQALLFDTVVESPTPLLAAAYSRQEPAEALFLKWVTTRGWSRLVETGGSPRRLDLEERAVSFLRLDPEQGLVEVRLQRLHPNPARSLRQEFELLWQEIAKVLAPDELEPVFVEPAIRQLLTSGRAQVERWNVKWSRGNLRGGIDPAMARSLFQRFRDYSAVGLTARWLFGNEPPTDFVQAKLDARNNVILVPKRCNAEQLAAVLEDVLRGGRSSLHTPELDRLAKQHEPWRPILQQIDREIRGQTEDKQIDLGRAARQTWFAEAAAIEVAEQLATDYPELFELRLIASCPKSGAAARAPEGGPVVYSRREEVPEQFECLHDAPRRFDIHPSAGNVAAVLVARPKPPRRSLLDRIEPRIERWVGQEAASLYMNILALLLFTLLYSGIVMLTTAGFLWLRTLFGGGVAVALALSVPFGLVLLLEAGIVIKLLGGPVTRMAVGILDRLAGIFDPRRGPRERGEWTSNGPGDDDGDKEEEED